MKLRGNRIPFLTAAGLVTLTSASAQIISDDFEVDTSGNYTVVNDGTPNGTQTWAFDYVAAGIPLAPRSAPGDTGGLRLTANDSAGATDAWTCFHNTPVSVAHYRLTVDVWMNFDALSGSTEHAHVGVGGDGGTFNQLFSPISGSGAFIAFDGDGGSISDYRWFRAVVNTPPGDPSNTTLPNDHPSYLGHGSNNTGSFFQSLFPAPPSTIAGSPGNIWTTLDIEVDNVNGVISFLFDDTLTFQGDFALTFDGFVSLGLADVFTSVSGASNLFTLYDNLVVNEIQPGPIGTNYCGPAIPNSTGLPGLITATGTIITSLNDVTLTATDLPSMQFGYFLTSQTQGFFNPPGSNGFICLGGSIGRYNQPGLVGQGPTITIQLDLTSVPVNPPAAVQPGDTWNFQCWYRDVGNTNNFTDGVEILFQ